MALAAIAEHCDLLVCDQAKISIGVVINFHLWFPLWTVMLTFFSIHPAVRGVASARMASETSSERQINSWGGLSSFSSAHHTDYAGSPDFDQAKPAHQSNEAVNFAWRAG